MKRIYLLLLLCSLPLQNLIAQPFSIEAEVLSAQPGSNLVLIKVRATPQPDFAATIFISAETPTLPGATILATPTMINPPYTDSVIVSILAPQHGAQLEHQIVLIGKNGPAIAYDTVTVEFPDHSAWRRLAPAAMEEAGMSGYSQLILDRENAFAWLLGIDVIGTWDGEQVVKVADVPSSPRDNNGRPFLISSTLDSAGGIWLLREGVIRRYDIETGEWWVIDRVDEAKGVSDTILGAASSTSPNRSDRMQTDSRGRVWIMSTAGLTSYDPATGEWHFYSARNSEFGVASWSNLPTFRPDLDGNLWIAQQNALVKWDGEYTTVYPWGELLGVQGADGRFAEVFDVDSRRRLWIRIPAPGGGANDVGVWTFIDQDDRVDRYVPYNEPDIRQSNPVDSIHLDSPVGFLANDVEITEEGEIWVALEKTEVNEFRFRYKVSTEGGLMRYVDGEWYHYTAENSGLPSNTVTYAAVDSRGRVWVRASGGLVLLDGNLLPEEAFSEASGVEVNDHGSNGELSGTLRLMPNPVVGDLDIECSLPAGTYTLAIHSVLGQTLHRRSGIIVTADRLHLQVPTAQLLPGAYFLQLTDAAGNRLSETFIKE